MALQFQPAKRTILGIWSNNCGPRRAALAELLLSLRQHGVRVESYGRCRHDSPQGLEYWNRPTSRMDRGHDQKYNESNFLPLAVCRQNRLMLAEENDLCPGYVGMNVVNAMQLCGAIPIIFEAGGLPGYEAEFGPFPHVNASRPGWCATTTTTASCWRCTRSALGHRHLPPCSQRRGLSTASGTISASWSAHVGGWRSRAARNASATRRASKGCPGEAPSSRTWKRALHGGSTDDIERHIQCNVTREFALDHTGHSSDRPHWAAPKN